MKEVVNALLIDTWFQDIMILIFKNTVIGNSNALIMQHYMYWIKQFFYKKK